MKPTDQDLIKFAKEVLAILETSREWSSDTADDISFLAMSRGLAKTGKEGFFESIVELS